MNNFYYKPVSPDLSSFQAPTPSNNNNNIPPVDLLDARPCSQHQYPHHHHQLHAHSQRLPPSTTSSSTVLYAPIPPNVPPRPPQSSHYSSDTRRPQAVGIPSLDSYQQSHPVYAHRQPEPLREFDYDIPSLPATHGFSASGDISSYISHSSQLPYYPYTSSSCPDASSISTNQAQQTMSNRVKRECGEEAKQLYDDNVPEMKQQIRSHNGFGPSMGVEIKTHFPVARIKRIMQADEEVGKVAQVTPVAVSKALELFMISLVSKSASLVRESSGKRITAQHLKKVIEADDQFDFLSEIVSKVVEGPEAGGKKLKDEGDSSEVEAKPTRKRGKGRKGD